MKKKTKGEGPLTGSTQITAVRSVEEYLDDKGLKVKTQRHKERKRLGKRIVLV